MFLFFRFVSGLLRTSIEASVGFRIIVFMFETYVVAYYRNSSAPGCSTESGRTGGTVEQYDGLIFTCQKEYAF